MDLLDELLQAPDRDHCPGVRPVVYVSGQEGPGFARALQAAPHERVVLARRGCFHGEYCVLASAGPEPTLARLSGRWLAARPIVLPGIAGALLHSEREELALAGRLPFELAEPGGLRRLVEQRLAGAGLGFELLARSQPFEDPERDLERVFVASPPPTPRGRRIQDLWLKSGWLSTYDEERSLRLRVSFGREREDDASEDLLRQRLAARLASAVLPCAAAATAHEPLRSRIEHLIGERALLTQAIGYWNAPEGGTLFHHDAFHEDGRDSGQLGVCYVQLTGATFWLALSTQDLAERVREFIDLLAEGELHWVRSRLAPGAREFEVLARLAADERALERELGLPGCGRLAALVNHGPEFSALLADAGHAALLQPGDAIVLPNHGPALTALHSVFSASEETGYALSLAIRSDREP